MKQIAKFNPYTVRSNKQFFTNKKEAMEVAKVRSMRVFKIKHGRYKGKYFVGSELEYFNY